MMKSLLLKCVLRIEQSRLVFFEVSISHSSLQPRPVDRLNLCAAIYFKIKTLASHRPT